jgi:hypothetical protein
MMYLFSIIVFFLLFKDQMFSLALVLRYFNLCFTLSVTDEVPLPYKFRALYYISIFLSFQTGGK